STRYAPSRPSSPGPAGGARKSYHPAGGPAGPGSVSPGAAGGGAVSSPFGSVREWAAAGAAAPQRGHSARPPAGSGSGPRQVGHERDGADIPVVLPYRVGGGADVPEIVPGPGRGGKGPSLRGRGRPVWPPEGATDTAPVENNDPVDTSNCKQLSRC